MLRGKEKCDKIDMCVGESERLAIHLPSRFSFPSRQLTLVEKSQTASASIPSTRSTDPDGPGAGKRSLSQGQAAGPSLGCYTSRWDRPEQQQHQHAANALDRDAIRSQLSPHHQHTVPPLPLGCSNPSRIDDDVRPLLQLLLWLLSSSL